MTKGQKNIARFRSKGRKTLPGLGLKVKKILPGLGLKVKKNINDQRSKKHQESKVEKQSAKQYAVSSFNWMRLIFRSCPIRFF